MVFGYWFTCPYLTNHFCQLYIWSQTCSHLNSLVQRILLIKWRLLALWIGGNSVNQTRVQKFNNPWSCCGRFPNFHWSCYCACVFEHCFISQFHTDSKKPRVFSNIFNQQKKTAFDNARVTAFPPYNSAVCALLVAKLDLGGARLNSSSVSSGVGAGKPLLFLS